MAGPITSFVTLKPHPESNIAEPEEEVGKILLQMKSSIIQRSMTLVSVFNTDIN